MRREPSIHTTRKNLIKAVDAALEVLEVELSCPTQMLVAQIMENAKKYSVNTRSLLVNTKAVAKKVEKLTVSDSGDARVFSKYLQMIRKQHFHRGINIIKEGSKDWALLKEVTKLALEFGQNFGLPREKAYTEYISIALTKMGKFSLARFNSIHPLICEVYEATAKLRAKGDSPLAEKVHHYYRQKIIDRTGSAISYKEIPEKYLYFVEVVEICEKLRVKPEVYIDAQFEGLDWAGGIPEPTSLVGVKAQERLQRHLYKHGIKAETQDAPKINWNKIKDAKNKNK